MKKYSVIGKHLPRIDGVVKATGEAKSTVDIFLPGMLYGKILRSPYPHARILNIDTSKAESLPGVRAVITCKDTPGIKFGLFDTPDFPADEYPLALDKVRYIGDEVAAIAAIDEDIAEEALDLVEVEYEELPAVFDPEEAMEPGSPQLHDHVERNISFKTVWDFGDLEKGFKESDYVREDRFTTQATAHCAFEPHVALASFDSSGSLTVWTSCQSPFNWALQLALTLDMQESKVRVLNPHVGGGFGGKVELFAYGFCAALLSKKTGRPVKITLTREEVFSTTRQRHPTLIDLKTGVKKDGILMAVHCKLIADGGAYTSTGPIFIHLFGSWILSAYRLPNLHYEGYRAYTNKSARGAQRGHGNPQPRFALDSQLDIIAEELGLDPVDIRLKNALRTNDILCNGTRITTSGLTECIQRAAESVGWRKKRGNLPKNRGMGMGCCGFLSGMVVPPYVSSGAFVKVHADGGVTVLAGIPEIGQGSDSAMSQIVADEMGIALEDVRIISGDTGIVPPHPGSYSNRGTLWAGNAVKAAALDAKQQLFEVIAETLEANVEDLEAKDRRIYVKGSPERGMAFQEAVLASLMGSSGNPILGRGYFKPNADLVNFETGKGVLTPAYGFDAHIAEVEVDPETGKVKVLKTTIANDCGVAINPMAVEGQIQGAMSMGLGQVVSEDVVMEKGLIMNPSFLTYQIVTALDIPDCKTILIEDVDPEIPLGAKTAEGTGVTALPAIANAIYDAIGVRIKDLPITPEKILNALKEKGGK